MANGDDKEKDKDKEKDADADRVKAPEGEPDKETKPEVDAVSSPTSRRRLQTCMSTWSDEKEERPDPELDPPLLLHVVAREGPGQGGRALGEAHVYREDSVLMLRKALAKAAKAPHLGELRDAEGQVLASHRSVEDAGLGPHAAVYTSPPQEVVLASASSDHSLRLWELQDGLCLDALPVHEAAVLSCAFSPAGGLLASGGEDSTARVSSVGDRSCVATLAGHGDWVNAVAFPRSRGERVLVTVSMDCSAKVWDIDYESCVLTMDGRVNPLFSVDCSPDGHTILVSGAPMAKDAQLFDVRAGAAVRAFEGADGHQDNVMHAVFGPDGSTILTGGQDKVAKLWDVGSGRCTATLKGHAGAVSSVASAPDGRQLCTGSHDRTVKLWRVRGGELECRATCAGHSGLISAVAFAPDGTSVASTGRDMTIRFWDATSGRALKTLDGHLAKVNALSFLPF